MRTLLRSTILPIVCLLVAIAAPTAHAGTDAGYSSTSVGTSTSTRYTQLNLNTSTTRWPNPATQSRVIGTCYGRCVEYLWMNVTSYVLVNGRKVRQNSCTGIDPYNPQKQFCSTREIVSGAGVWITGMSRMCFDIKDDGNGSYCRDTPWVSWMAP